jgi:starch synthase
VTKAGYTVTDTGKQVGCFIGDKSRPGRIFKAEGNFPAQRYFVANDSYFDREELYQTQAGDYPDNSERFIFFSKALLATAKAVGFKPDIVHFNDWQTALGTVFLKTSMSNDTFFAGAKTLLTIHNLGYQGLFWHWDWPMLNLGWEYFEPEHGLEFYGKINFLKGGIIFADAVNTVSKKYAKEIQTEEHGSGLDGVLRKYSSKLFGILNGIDPSVWNPAIDRHIAKNFTAADLSGKDACKADLQKAVGLPLSPDAPLIGIISRFIEQKGIQLIIEGAPDIVKLKGQLVLLGRGERETEMKVAEVAKAYPQSVAAMITFSDKLAHQIEAGSDFFLMPSLYEPCGLNQMYSLAYATIPIVRATGGLDDTITNYSERTGRGNGFKFRDFSVKAMMTSVKKAVNLYKKPKAFAKLRSNAFHSDFTWKRSAQEYLKLYRKLIKGKIPSQVSSRL